MVVPFTLRVLWEAGSRHPDVRTGIETPDTVLLPPVVASLPVRVAQSDHWSFSLDALLVIAGFVVAVGLYRLQLAADRKRDIDAARSVLVAVQEGIRVWAEDYFKEGWADPARAASRANGEYLLVMKRQWGFVYGVPTDALTALLGNPAAGRWISEQTVAAVGLAVWHIRRFNQFVRQQTDFMGHNLVDIYDPNLPAPRREALARAAEGQSLVLHFHGIGDTSWYRDLKDQLAKNITWLDEQRKPWCRR